MLRLGDRLTSQQFSLTQSYIYICLIPLVFCNTGDAPSLLRCMGSPITSFPYDERLCSRTITDNRDCRLLFSNFGPRIHRSLTLADTSCFFASVYFLCLLGASRNSVTVTRGGSGSRTNVTWASPGGGWGQGGRHATLRH